MESSSSPKESPVRRFFLTNYQKIVNWLFVTTPNSQPLERSYLFLRTGIGIIGIALPIVLIIGTILLERRFELWDSMSSYYYSVMRNVFVGSLWAIGIFLICYRYDNIDNIVSTIAGIAAIGVSLFPTTPVGAAPTQQQQTIGNVHFSLATCFLVTLAVMAIWLFTRTNPDPNQVTDRKLQRNIVYRCCGIVIFACIGLAALTLFVPNLPGTRWLYQNHPILWIEIIATMAFGIAWFVKGETFVLKDP